MIAMADTLGTDIPTVSRKGCLKTPKGSIPVCCQQLHIADTNLDFTRRWRLDERKDPQD
jgi:hypothetical protein